MNKIIQGILGSVRYLDQTINIADDGFFAASVRIVVGDYNGPCMRVRRSSDNAEQDINFLDGYIDTASLLSFVGAGDGFVTIWYDQLEVQDINQSNTSQQPRIVTSGVLETDGGKSLAAIYFFGGQNLRTSTPNNVGFPAEVFLLARKTAGVYLFMDIDTSTTGQFRETNGNWTIRNTTQLSGSPVDSDQHVFNIKFNGGSSEIRIDTNTDVTGNSGSSSIDLISLGASRSGLSPMTGFVTEMIWFNSILDSGFSDKKTNNINNYYQVF